MSTAFVKRTGKLVADSFKRYVDNDGFVYSASISYNMLIASIPFLFILFVITGFFIPQIISDQAKLRDMVGSFFPFSTNFIIQNIDLLYRNRGTLGVLGVIALFLATYSLTNAVYVSLSAMIARGKRISFTRTLITHATGIALFTALLIGVMMGGSLLAIFQGFSSHIDTPIVKLILNKTIIFIKDSLQPFVIALVTTLVYRHLTPVHIPYRAACTGGIFFTILIIVIKTVFIVYTGKISKLGLIYGSIFGVICFIIATYIFATVFLFTACVIEEYLKAQSIG